jgi:hypothetical protein
MKSSQQMGLRMPRHTDWRVTIYDIGYDMFRWFILVLEVGVELELGIWTGGWRTHEVGINWDLRMGFDIGFSCG